ncbi:hypothetical protein EVAR_83368_1 [Eumeta japonica]|uniref:Uncharacterized protein n=1 Tax=Eumeta variegata TaxID=151549 RepID=A0A4C1TZM0_EUMVA|nr:hypothetical protein EVAR_83368_1 [Eumeta japonica]
MNVTRLFRQKNISMMRKKKKKKGGNHIRAKVKQQTAERRSGQTRKILRHSVLYAALARAADGYYRECCDEIRDRCLKRSPRQAASTNELRFYTSIIIQCKIRNIKQSVLSIDESDDGLHARGSSNILYVSARLTVYTARLDRSTTKDSKRWRFPKFHQRAFALNRSRYSFDEHSSHSFSVIPPCLREGCRPTDCPPSGRPPRRQLRQRGQHTKCQIKPHVAVGAHPAPSLNR